jgi:hypothetical protein
MVQSLEEYVSQATRAYQPTTTAIQAQINALPGQLESSNEQINRNYAQQQAGLNRQRNMAAETASMQAAGSGGSFGGASNIANRKYYDQTFVPAVTQMRANQTNELERARQANEDARLSLSGQLANIESQANQQALAQYYSDLEAERAREAQLRAQREAQAAQNAYYQYLMEAAKQNQATAQPRVDKSQVSFTDWLNNDSYGALDLVRGNSLNEKIGALKTISSMYGAANNSLGKKLGVAQNIPLYQDYLKWRNS